MNLIISIVLLQIYKDTAFFNFNLHWGSFYPVYEGEMIPLLHTTFYFFLELLCNAKKIRKFTVIEECR